MAETFQNKKSTNESQSHIPWWPDFAYSQQPLKDDQIRILEILPGGNTTRLRCRLRVVHRYGPEPYKALSYTWGISDPDAYILIDNKAFWIRENLRHALYRIRRTDRVVRLWTDAICINQESATEKNVQVQRMGDTYAQADEVLIWLGSGGSNSRVLSELCELSRRISEISRDELKTKMSPVIDFFRSQWFGRLWVLQEVILARKATVLLGVEECDLSLLYGVSDGSVKIQSSYDSLPEDFGRVTENLSLFSDLILMRLAMASNNNPESVGWGYINIVCTCSKRVCGDARDHVFGLVGIAEHHGMKAETVDYALSVREVYKTFAQNALMDNLNRLVTLDGLFGGSSIAELPSWVPDFSRPGLSNPYAIQFYMAGGKADTHGLPESSFSYDDTTLNLTGYMFDKIDAHRFCESSLDMHLTGEDGEIVGPFTLHGQIAEGLWLRHRADVSPYGNGQGQIDACWRTLVGNSRRTSRPGVNGMYVDDMSTLDGLKQYNIVMERANWPVEDEAEFEEVTSFIVSGMTYNRSLLLTHNGYFGLGPKGAMSEDLIVIVPGLTMPLILREGSTSNRCQLIGVAYIHGIMKGEFMEKVLQMPERLPETYIIE